MARDANPTCRFIRAAAQIEFDQLALGIKHEQGRRRLKITQPGVSHRSDHVGQRALGQ